MPLIVNTNVASLTAQRHLTNNTAALNRSMEKLASGHRINRAGDDAAGLQLSENLRAQIRGSQKALDNVQDGINFLNVADGAMAQIGDNLQRARELLVQAASDTYSLSQRAVIQKEFEQLMMGIDQISNSTEYNGIHMIGQETPPAGTGVDFAAQFPGPFGFRIQLGPNSEPPFTPVGQYRNSINLNANNELGNLSANNMGVIVWNAANTLTINLDTRPNIMFVMGEIDTCLRLLNGHRAGVGALVNRLEGAASNLQISIENLSASESRIRNVDVASESANITRNQILQQASAGILAQANQAPSLALQLLKST